MEEIWKDIEGYEGLYQVSNFGRVKSMSRMLFNGKVYWRSDEKIMSPIRNKAGYSYITLCSEGKQKRRSVHYLVCSLFIPNEENKVEIDHINTIVTDNRAVNLRWCTKKENQNNPITIKNQRDSHIGQYQKKGIDNKKSIPILQYSKNGEFIKKWYGSKEVARSFPKGDNSYILRCCRGEYKTAYGFIWKFEEDQKQNVINTTQKQPKNANPIPVG